MTDSMVERVARATYEKYMEGVEDLEPKWDEMEESHRHRMIDAARAGMEAMREPTEAMIVAGDDAPPNDLFASEKASRLRYMAMIVAAISHKDENLEIDTPCK